MAIKETIRKIHFRSYSAVKGKPVDNDPAPTVIVSRKYNTLTFSKGCITATQMSGKFVKLFYEPTKKIIGWQAREGTFNQEELKQWRLCKPAKNGIWVMGVKGILDQFAGLNKDSYHGLEVKRYREMGKLEAFSGETFHYVEVRDKEADEESLKP